MERSFLEYSMSVIVSRALPDVRDGLKPVHRRILYSMYDQRAAPRPAPHQVRQGRRATSWGRTTRTATRRSTRRWPAWSRTSRLRHPLIDGHGNFGGTGPDDGPAAMRYTECRLAPLALELLAGIDEETVDFDRQLRRHRPRSRRSCPARFPNLLVNGSQGIAVGMATNIPPHNLGEVIDATIHLLEHPDATPDDLMEFVKGPDFPTGALILGRQGILDAYRTGPGLDQDARRRRDRRGPDGGDPHRRHRAARTRPRSRSIEQKITELVRAGDLDGIARCAGRLVGRQEPAWSSS